MMNMTKVPGKGIEIDKEGFTFLRTHLEGPTFWHQSNQVRLRKWFHPFLPKMSYDVLTGKVTANLTENGQEWISQSEGVKGNRFPVEQLAVLKRKLEELRVKAEDETVDKNARTLLKAFRLPDPATSPEMYRLFYPPASRIPFWERLLGKKPQPRMAILWGMEKEDESSIPVTEMKVEEAFPVNKGKLEEAEKEADAPESDLPQDTEEEEEEADTPESDLPQDTEEDITTFREEETHTLNEAETSSLPDSGMQGGNWMDSVKRGCAGRWLILALLLAALAYLCYKLLQDEDDSRRIFIPPLSPPSEVPTGATVREEPYTPRETPAPGNRTTGPAMRAQAPSNHGPEPAEREQDPSNYGPEPATREQDPGDYGPEPAERVHATGRTRDMNTTRPSAPTGNRRSDREPRSRDDYSPASPQRPQRPQNADTHRRQNYRITLSKRKEPFKLKVLNKAFLSEEGVVKVDMQLTGAGGSELQAARVMGVPVHRDGTVSIYVDPQAKEVAVPVEVSSGGKAYSFPYSITVSPE